jgi:hypothetical protein
MESEQGGERKKKGKERKESSSTERKRAGETVEKEKSGEYSPTFWKKKRE